MIQIHRAHILFAQPKESYFLRLEGSVAVAQEQRQLGISAAVAHQQVALAIRIEVCKRCFLRGPASGDGGLRREAAVDLIEKGQQAVYETDADGRRNDEIGA